MKRLIKPTKYYGSINAPASKSFMQRAIALALLSKGETILSNPDFSNDSKAALKIAENLGAKINYLKDKIHIEGSVSILNTELSAGESGLAARCFIPIASLFAEKITFSGEGSLKTRPLSMLISPLNNSGVKVTSHNGYLPFTTQGPMLGGKIEIDGSISSQALTGLLIALPKAKNDSCILVHNLQSIPYINMTLQILKDFDINVINEDYKLFRIEGNQNYKARNYEIEGDWSSAAFHLVGGAIGGSVTVSKININSTQADRFIIDALRSAGAEINYSVNNITVKKNMLKAFTFDATQCPDLFPPLSNLAAVCEGISIIKGTQRLIHKESNRALSIQKEWNKLGIKVDLIDDEMHITGGEILGGEIDSHNDHRIAMMGAIAAINSNSPIEINNSEAINKSYPSFYKDFEKLSNPIESIPIS